MSTVISTFSGVFTSRISYLPSTLDEVRFCWILPLNDIDSTHLRFGNHDCVVTQVVVIIRATGPWLPLAQGDQGHHVSLQQAFLVEPSRGRRKRRRRNFQFVVVWGEAMLEGEGSPTRALQHGMDFQFRGYDTRILPESELQGSLFRISLTGAGAEQYHQPLLGGPCPNEYGI
ncbi:hypothetical protein Pelo_18515 [Pelomyxa schiedti]|nr:hypothetical protein Pelo_18515 [Pelomyxa schiedti]